MTQRFVCAMFIILMAASALFAQSPPMADVPIVSPQLAPDILAYRRNLPEARPPLQSWWAPILDNTAQMPPFDEPAADAPPEVRNAATIIAHRLARDGLLSTLAQAIEILGPAKFGKDAAADAETLRAVGLPVDLLPCFNIAGANDGDAIAIIRYVASRIAAGQSPELKAELATAAFQFKPSRAGFRIATESGEEDIGLVRVQLAKGEYWHGIGDGGALDIIRQLAAVLPDAKFLVSTQQGETTRLIGLMRLWPNFRADRFTVIAEPLTVGQWAQDNGKPGIIESDTIAKRRIATLVPRYASRGDDGSTFIPGETFMADGWAAAGLTVIQSPLLFQGGNLMSVLEPQSAELILLIGEAEIYRNTALGLTRDQVLEAFRIEMGVDRCIVLPAVSYHIDYEVSVRAVGDRLVAFVNDTPAAAKEIITIGLAALQNGGALTPPDGDKARALLLAGHARDMIQLLDDKLFHGARQQGQFPESLTRLFSKSLIDSGVGNFQRFLLALDLVIAEAQASDAPVMDPNFAEYIAAIRRRNDDRKRLHQQLADLGWHVALIPSLAEADRSINYLNGIHARGVYLMPSYGGLYAPLDAAAAEAIRKALGPDVRVIPILSAESQRRNGAVHCAAAVYPRTD